MNEPPSLLTRAFGLLRLIAAAGRRGASLSDLVQQSALPHATVHRLLRQLAGERMVVQLEQTRRHALGPMAYELGVAAYPYDLRGVSQPSLEALARETEDSVFLSLRSGDEAVCIDLHPGTSPVRVITLEVGTRRPLGAGAGGLAILGALPADERQDVFERVAPVLKQTWGLSGAALEESIRLFDKEGYALIRNRVHAGVSAVGYPVRGASGQPIAALSIASFNERLGPQRVASVVGRLRQAARDVQDRLAATRTMRPF